MGPYAILAEALRYPNPGRLDQLDGLSADLPSNSIKNAFEGFMDGIRALDLGAWEELHTRTLDLNPPAAPYIGYQTWGDSYQRGTFLSMMSRALETYQVDTEGELPDHLIPVLRLLDRLEEPFSELQEVLDKAIERIRTGLSNADPENPYVALFAAISLACNEENASSS